MLEPKHWIAWMAVIFIAIGILSLDFLVTVIGVGTMAMYFFAYALYPTY